MLRSYKQRYPLYSRQQCLAFIGGKFRVVLRVDEQMTDVECGEYLTRRLILVHLRSDRDKFNLLMQVFFGFFFEKKFKFLKKL
jgi:DNA-directed RNA polymerase I subunit RPA2